VGGRDTGQAPGTNVDPVSRPLGMVLGGDFPRPIAAPVQPKGENPMTSRAALLSNLSKVESAVSDSTAIPVLCQFWFTGKRLVAFNGIIGISVPCVTDFKGGVPKTLKQLLETSAAKEIELFDDKGALHVKAASAKFKLAIMPLEDFAEYLETSPPLPKEPYEVDLQQFTDALNMCMRSIGNEKVRADMMGVTAIRTKKKLMLFGHDRVTVSYGSVTGQMDAKRAIIPVEWCKQAVSLFKDDGDDVMVEITDNDCLMGVPGGTKLWAQTLMPDDGELDFIGEVLEANPGDLYPIPEKFPAAIQRAAIIGKSGIARTKTRLTVEDGGMVTMFTKSEAGDVTDQCILKGHGGVDVTVDASRVQEGADLEEILVTERALVMSKESGRLMYFISLMDN